MAALTADKSRTISGTPNGVSAGVAASTEIFSGSLLAFDAGGSLIPAADTAALAFAGVAGSYVNNTGADDAVSIVRQLGHMEWFNHTALAQADLQKNVYVSDDNTVTDAAAATNDLMVGTLMALDGSTALIWVGVFAALNA